MPSPRTLLTVPGCCRRRQSPPRPCSYVLTVTPHVSGPALVHHGGTPRSSFDTDTRTSREHLVRSHTIMRRFFLSLEVGRITGTLVIWHCMYSSTRRFCMIVTAVE